MDYRVVEGSSFTASVELLDDTDSPVVPASGYPRVQVLDADKDVVGTFPTHPSANTGTWEASVSLPDLGLKKITEFRLRWLCKSATGDRYKVYDLLHVSPKVELRESELVTLPDDDFVEFVLPFRYVVGQTPTSCKLFSQNNQVLAELDLNDPSVDLEASIGRTNVTIKNPGLDASLQASLLLVKAKVDGHARTFSYRYWSITPQILVASTMVETFLNKARIENVIPELRYTDGDLISYLERGLYMFNTTGYPTGFTGTNMQGAILDAWVTCSTYWALSSQMLAEGSLAFDFSGQGISFNVDRTPQLEAALGRIESRIQDTVVPLKKQLASQNLIAGDGSVGATAMRNPYASGTLSLTNSPTTRLSGFSNYVGRRF